MTMLTCAKCSGEGTIYTSRYGGNDPDVWPTGECPACKGSGQTACESHGCDSDAIGFDEDGRALCADCLFEWAENYRGEA